MGGFVYGKCVVRVEEYKSKKRSGEYAQNLRHIGCEQELDSLADVIVNSSALAYCGNDGCKVVVCQNHIGNVLGNVGTCDTHTNTDVSGLD